MKDREHREKILLVENNKEIAKFIIDNLENNYEIIQSHSGKDANEVIKNEDLGIVLIDIMVQKLDVFESNVATAHPIAAELRGMTVPSLCSFVFIQNPKASFG